MSVLEIWGRCGKRPYHTDCVLREAKPSTCNFQPATAIDASRSPFGGPLNRDRNRPVNNRGAELFEAEFEADLFHDGEAEVGFVASGVFDLAIGFVNAHELRPFLELFFRSHGGE